MKEKQKHAAKTAAVAAALLISAVASFVSMDHFQRQIFSNNPRWYFSFFALAGCMLLIAAVKKPALSLAVAAAAALGMSFYTLLYPALFFPVALQAVLYDAAFCRPQNEPAAKKNKKAPQKNTGGSTAAGAAAIALYPVCLWLTVKAYQYDDLHNRTALAQDDPAALRILCMALLPALAAYFVYSAIKTQRQPGEKKNGRARRSGENVRFLQTAAYTLPALHSVLLFVYCVLFFGTDYPKLFLCAEALFLLFTLYRQGLPQKRINLSLSLPEQSP